MASVANTFTSFAAIGNREDLADIIYDISPTDTPFTGRAGKSKADNVKHEWQTDKLAAAGPNAQVEGNDTTFSPVTPTVRVDNYCQIMDKDLIVSNTQEAIKKAGRKSDFVRETLKRSKELKRDCEYIMLNNQAPVAGNETTARQLRPVNSWLTTNVSRGSGGANGDAGNAATDGTTRPLTEALVKDVLASAFVAGGEPDLIMVGAKNKQAVSSWTAGATKFDKTEDKKLTAAIDIYASDYGDLHIKANRFQRERDCFILDMEYWKLAWLRKAKTHDLAPTGDAKKGLMNQELTLEACNEASSGIVADLTTPS